MVDAFLAEGARVAVLERDAAKCEAFGRAPRVPVDRRATPRRRRRTGARRCRRGRFGGLDVLVNCVGIFDFYRSIADLDADVLDVAFDEMFAST